MLQILCFKSATLGASVTIFQDDDLVEIEGVYEPRRLGSNDDLAVCRALLHHGRNQADGSRMQAEFGLVEEHDVGQHVGRKVQERYQSEQAQRSVGRKVCSDCLVSTLGLPAQQHRTVGVVKFESGKVRKHAADVVADHLVATYVFAFEPEEYRGEIAAVGAKLTVVVRVPPLLEVGLGGRVVKLINRTAPQQCCDHASRLAAGAAGLGGFEQLGFGAAIPRRNNRGKPSFKSLVNRNASSTNMSRSG